MNSIATRDDFNNAVAIFQQWAGPNVDVVKQFKLTQSELRLEQPLSANNSLYNFQVMNNMPGQGGQIFNTELRLNMQDTFVPTHVRVSLANPSSASDATFRLYTYPNQSVFANALQMRSLYNGQLKISVANYNYLYNWGLQRHWFSPQTQQTAAFGPGSPEDQLNGADDGFCPLQPYVLFGGSQNVQIQIQLTSNPPSAVDANARYVMQFYGVVAQNSTPVA